MTYTYSLQAQILEVEREVKKRREVYARMVSKGDLRQAQADWLIGCMEAVKQTLVEMKRLRDE